MKWITSIAAFISLLALVASVAEGASNSALVRVKIAPTISILVPQGTTLESLRWDDASGARVNGPGFEMLVYYGNHDLAEERPYKLCATATGATTRIDGKKAALLTRRDSSQAGRLYFVGLCMPEANVDPRTSSYITDRSGTLSLRAEYLQLIVLGYTSDASAAERVKAIYESIHIDAAK